MKHDFLEVGKIVGTHGVRGILRIQPWCDSAEFLCGFKRLYLDRNGTSFLEVKSAQPHGNVVIAAVQDTDSIEAAEKYRNKVLYINRADASLEEGQYFIEDLIGCDVFDADTKEALGKICDVSQTGANDVWHIIKEGREYLIPCIDEVVLSVDIEGGRVLIRPLKGIFDDEN